MNEALVKGAAYVGKSKNNMGWATALAGSIDSSMNNIAKASAEQKRVKAAIDGEVAGYINSLSEPDLGSLSPEQNKAVTDYLVKQKSVYAQAATRLAGLSPTDDSAEYTKVRDEMNRVKSSFSNLSTQLKAWKEDKANYLKDFDGGMLSDGNDLSSLGQSANIYTNKAPMIVGEGGTLSFYDENKGIANEYSSIKKPFLKDFKGMDTILNLNESVYKTGRPLSGPRKDLMRNKIRQMINKGGDDSLMSLATDDFLVEGGLNIQDPELFKPENKDALKNYVIDSYLDVISNAANQGAAEKQADEEAKYRRNKNRTNQNNQDNNLVGGRSLSERQAIKRATESIFSTGEFNGRSDYEFNFKGTNDAKSTPYKIIRNSLGGLSYIKGDATGKPVPISAKNLYKELGLN